MQQQTAVASEPVATAITAPTATASQTTASSTLIVDMSSQLAPSSTTINQSVPLESYSLAYVQQSWVKNFVSADPKALGTSAEEDELLIALPV